VQKSTKAVAALGLLALVGSVSAPAVAAGRKTAGTKIVKIGFIAPLSGDLSALGLGMKNSVDLAIKEANASKAIPGYTIVLAAEDDQAKADIGAQAAAKLAADPSVAAVIGTLNSSVALQTRGVLDKANVAQISPANTNPTLTQGDNYATAKVRPFKNYFRLATTDAIQGPFAAQFVFKTLGLKKVAIIHDQKTYGKGLTDEFIKEYKKRGGEIVAQEVINPGDKDFSAVIAKVKPTGAQLVYYGGEYPEASLLTNQMKAAAVNIPVMGGDGMQDDTYIKNAGDASNGDFATQVGAPTESLATAKAFLAAYAKAGYAEGYSPYGAGSYDSAKIIIDALKKSLTAKTKAVKDARPAIITAIQATKYSGATGNVSFDEFGDTTNKVLTVYSVAGGKWVPKVTDTFS
jgi:branched-chain amino acid transport system substrate-binding protein